MKILLPLLIILVGVGAFVFIPSLRARVPGIPNLFPQVSLPSISLSQFRNSSPAIELAASASAESKPSVLGATILNTGTALGQFAGSVFTTTASPGANVDVAAVTKQISDHIEQIPSNALKQAKIEYCKQVLLDAQTEASKTP